MTDAHHTANAPPDGAVTADLLAQLENTLWLPQDLDQGTRAARLAAARAVLTDINPAPGLEAMLACQMVAAHEAAMACLGRSAAPQAAPEQTDRNLKHAERLMALFTRQMDVLGRHRAREHKRAEQQARQEKEQRFRNPEPRKIERVFVNPDGTVATPEELAEDRARMIADGTLVSTPPLARQAAEDGAPPDHTAGTGDGPPGDGVHDHGPAGDEPASDEARADRAARDKELMRQYNRHRGPRL